MTVRELIKNLEICDQDIQVVVICDCVKEINAIEQSQPYSLSDDSEYPNVVEIITK